MVIAGEIKYIKDIILKIKKKKKNFKLSNRGPIEYILGIKVEEQNNRYIITQKSFY